MAQLELVEDGLRTRIGGPVIVGRTPEMLRLFEAIWRLRNVPTNVLIQGETGAGKEMVASAIHHLADAKEHRRPFVAYNCANIPRDLAESTLFGHVKGSFTGAIDNQAGLMEQAHQGTLFLDEIGEMPLALQAKLLRFMDNGKFMRIGEYKEKSSEVRLIGATNRDLGDREIFRQDLYHRIAGYTIRVPSLRERIIDIPLLATHLLRRHSRINPRVIGIADRALENLMEHDWPGNVRELSNVIERALIHAQSDRIDIDDISLNGDSAPKRDVSLELQTDGSYHIIVRDLRLPEPLQKAHSSWYGEGVLPVTSAWLSTQTGSIPRHRIEKLLSHEADVYGEMFPARNPVAVIYLTPSNLSRFFKEGAVPSELAERVECSSSLADEPFAPLITTGICELAGRENAYVQVGSILRSRHVPMVEGALRPMVYLFRERDVDSVLAGGFAARQQRERIVGEINHRYDRWRLQPETLLDASMKRLGHS